MRTTIDLPDELFRQVKARAALEGRKLKDLIAAYVQQGLQRESRWPAEEVRGPDSLPCIAKASVGGTIPSLTSDELAQIEEEEDLERYHRSFGR